MRGKEKPPDRSQGVQMSACGLSVRIRGNNRCRIFAVPVNGAVDHHSGHSRLPPVLGGVDQSADVIGGHPGRDWNAVFKKRRSVSLAIQNIKFLLATCLLASLELGRSGPAGRFPAAYKFRFGLL